MSFTAVLISLLPLAKRPINERPDGIISATDTLGIGCINAILTESDIRVPDDISVISCENAKTEPVGMLPLTSVEPSAADIGRKAMTQMLDHIEDADAHVHATALIKPTLVRRLSTKH